MIPKQQILDLAERFGLQPTTIEKDYALGWLLIGVSRHSVTAKWTFKGGTCLKKCFFETYRFSEDLDFTVPREESLTEQSIRTWLGEIATRLEPEVGLQFPRDRINVEKYTNPRGHDSFQAKLTYVGPLGLARHSLQRVKFDLTQDELQVDEPELREVFHPYDDSPQPPPRVRCYSLNEILAEKTRALCEREGRARDVYDVVHLNREFKDAISAAKVADIARRKFAFKELDPPTVELILSHVDRDALAAAWNQQLRHQLPHLPPVETFFDELRSALAWWLEPTRAQDELPAIPTAPSEQAVPRDRFPAMASFGASSRLGAPLDLLRYAARNRLCAILGYHGIARTVEPYSLRLTETGNLLLYAYEIDRGGHPTHGLKAYRLAEIGDASVLDRPFVPRYRVEL